MPEACSQLSSSKRWNQHYLVEFGVKTEDHPSPFGFFAEGNPPLGHIPLKAFLGSGNLFRVVPIPGDLEVIGEFRFLC